MGLVDERALRALVADLVAAELARPALVSQRTVEAVVGLPCRDYLRLARAGAFPTTKERRLVLAKTEDVMGVFLVRLQRRAPANDTTGDDLDRALARVGARRVPRP